MLRGATDATLSNLDSGSGGQHDLNQLDLTWLREHGAGIIAQTGMLAQLTQRFP